MQISLGPSQTVTINDVNGVQTIALDSFTSLLTEAKRVGVNLDSQPSLAAIGQAVKAAGGKPGLLVTRNGAQLTLEYVGAQNFERFVAWCDGSDLGQFFGNPATFSIPPQPAGAHQITVSANWASVPIADPGQRLQFYYISDGSGYSQVHPTPMPLRSGVAIQPLGGLSTRSIFGCGSIEILNSPALQADFAAGVFTNFEEGLLQGIAYPSLAATEAQFDALLARAIGVCQQYNVKFICIGDDAARFGQLQNSLTGWGPQFIQYAASRMQASGYLLGMAVVDEADLFTQSDSALVQQFTSLVRSSAPGIQLWWPTHATGNALFDPLSDLIDVYFFPHENRYARTDGSSGNQYRNDIEASVANASNTKPYLGLVSIAGGSGGFDGVRPELVTLNIFLHWCYGAIGYRSYEYDNGQLISGQAGGTPAGVGADRYAAMKASYLLISQLEQRVGFGAMTQDTRFDPDVVKTTRGNVTIAVNSSEMSRPLNGLPAPAYRLTGSTYNTRSWTGMLQPLEVAVWTTPV